MRTSDATGCDFTSFSVDAVRSRRFICISNDVTCQEAADCVVGSAKLPNRAVLLARDLDDLKESQRFTKRRDRPRVSSEGTTKQIIRRLCTTSVFNL